MHMQGNISENVSDAFVFKESVMEVKMEKDCIIHAFVLKQSVMQVKIEKHSIDAFVFKQAKRHAHLLVSP